MQSPARDATATTSAQPADGLKMVHNNEDAMNKIPLKSVAAAADDEEKQMGEFVQDTAAADEARRERRRAKLLSWMKKLTIGLICFIGIALICYVIISLSLSDWSQTTTNTNTSAAAAAADANATATATTINTTVTNTTNTTITTITTTILTSSSTNPASRTTSNSSLSSDDKSAQSTASTSPNNATTATAAVGTATTPALTNTTSFPRDSTLTPHPPTQPTAHTPSALPSSQLTPSSPSSPSSPSPLLTATAADEKAATEATKSPPLDVPITGANFTSKLGVYQHAALCSDKEVCSQIGSNILQQNGSAVDAAIAALLCNGIATMQSMGIGGGMLMNVYVKERRHAYSIDAREVAPYAATRDMFNGNTSTSLVGGLAIAVPGELMGYQRAHERFGKLPWKALVEPSLKLCEEGFYLSDHQWRAFKTSWKKASGNPLLRKVFLNEATGELHPVGTKLRPQQELCHTYQLLAENGATDFYNGTLAELVAADLRDLGSIVSQDDLETYRADLVSSITMQLGNDILYTVPPISSGSVVANVLSILEGYNFSRADLQDAQSEALTIHRMAEAMKFGYAKRWELGDLRFNDVRELVSRLTNPETGIELRALINDSYVLGSPSAYGAQFSGSDDVGTSPLVVMAPNGDAVAITSSINNYYGSGLIGKRTGIMFNSAMNDFSIPGHSNQFGLPSAPSNFIEPQKRPMSSMAPLILADQKGNIRTVLASAGGSKIISTLAEVVARILWFGQDVKEAIDAPRFHHQLVPDVLEYEAGGFSEEILKVLQAKGHKLAPFNDGGSVVCGIVSNATAIYANADYRKRGGIAGF